MEEPLHLNLCALFSIISKMENQIYELNEFLTLRLEDGHTRIYVAEKYFNQCKFLMLNIPVEEVGIYDETSTFESIDAASEMLDHSMEPLKNKTEFTYQIPPEEEFWGLCSNLEVWVERGYDTKILHSNLAFPLLRRLTEVGDPQAKKVFNQEIAARYNTGIESVREYLRSNKYLDYLSEEEFLDLLTDADELDVILRLKDELLRTDNLDIDIKKGKAVRIRLQAQKLIKVPKMILQFTSIEHLSLSYNELEELPEWIGEFQKLKKLEVSNNRLKKLPDTIGKLKSLEDLRLNINELTALPETIGKLKSLKNLVLYRNKIRTLPNSVGSLTDLISLDLHENELTLLPRSIGNLKNLEVLKVHKNSLFFLPESIGKTENLKLLYLEKNSLKRLPESMKNLKNLEMVSIDDNPINKIPELYELPKLKDLYINNTCLSEYQIKKKNFSWKHINVHYLKIMDIERKKEDWLKY